MSDKGNIPKPFSTVIAAIISIITFITTIVGFVLLWQGNQEIVSTTVLAVALVGFWLLLFYVRNRRIGNKPNKYRYARKVRNLATVGIYALPVVVVFMSIAYYQASNAKENIPSGEIVVLLTNFRGPNEGTWGINENLYENLTEASRTLSRLKIVRTDKSVISDSSNINEELKTLAEAENAHVVIWGWYVANGDKISVTYHIFNVERYNSWTKSFTNAEASYKMSFDTAEGKVFTYPSSSLADNVRYDLFINLTMNFISVQNFSSASTVNAQNRYFIEDNADSFADYIRKMSIITSMQGVIFAGDKEVDRGIETAKKAVEMDPSIDTYANLATVYRIKGDTAEAEQYYVIAIPYYDQGISPFYELGGIYLKQEKYQEAITILGEGIEHNPICDVAKGCHMLYYERGVAFLKVGKKLEADADFMIVKELLNDPKLSAYLDSLLSDNP